MIETIIASVWPYALAGLALVAGWFTAKHQGKVQAERDRLAKIQEQQTKTQQEKADVQEKVRQMGDDALLDRARDRWVRK